jgi:hypothetical protein
MLMFAAGTGCVVVNYLADAQRYRVRDTGGNTNVWGKPPVLLVGRYTMAQGKQSSGMIAAEAVSRVLSNTTDETQARAEYETRCRRTFRASFWSAKIWRRFVTSPVLDWVVSFGQLPAVKTALARIMAQM